MRALRRTAAFSRVSQLAERRLVHEAFQWLHLHEPQIMRWQTEMVGIAAPPFGERARAEWLLERFRDLGLDPVEIDGAGNALGLFRQADPERSTTEEQRPCILISAHIDTVFPLETPINPAVKGQRLSAPGACDNGAGVAGMLALAAGLKYSGIETGLDLLFVGNVGEEGEGDLRGIRYLYQNSPGREKIAAHVVLDGAGHEVAVTQAVGSRRYLATITGSGGHSWSDAGQPNPIVALSRAISRWATTPTGGTGRSTLNVGTIQGGTSINAIPQQASARFDLRSTDPEQLIRLEVDLYRALEDAVLSANTAKPDDDFLQQPLTSALPPQNEFGPKVVKRLQPLQLSIEKIGDRPAGHLPATAPILETLRAVDRHLGIRTEERMASTDANIPLSLGVEAVSIGAGGEGGGIHTSNEWYDARGRELGLRRILLLVLALSEESAAP